MYKADVRFNKVLTYMLWCMAICCGLNFILAYYETHDISIKKDFASNLQVFDYDKKSAEEYAGFKFDFEADIEGLFNWNTGIIFASIYCEWKTEDSDLNKVVVWDQRVRWEDSHYLNLNQEWFEYYLTDITKSLREKEVTVYFKWEQMTTVGPFYSR